MEENLRRHLPLIPIYNKYAPVTGSKQSMTSSPDSARKLSFARISRLHSSREGLSGSRRSQSQSSLPGYAKPRSRFYPQNISDGCLSRSGSNGSNGQLNGVVLPDVSRSDLLKKNFLRLKCSSAVNYHSGVTCSCPSVGSASHSSPPNIPSGSGSAIHVPPRRVDVLLPRRARTDSLATMLIGVPSTRRQATEVTLITTAVTPIAEVAAISELNRLSELTHLPETIRASAPSGSAQIEYVNERLSDDEVAVCGSVESMDSSNDVINSAERQVSEETLNKCVNWLLELEEARSRSSLDAVVETPVEWRD
ncbi:hypothetical protein LSH36_74g04016 [Paralvinella palmiformis]|uniref:Uncharacterized protein n=1 Tax=Paralvinella palmiformis TaxID=53620 RepID=A0AAD9K2M0_9ANNE|nr:hypothetical protein LSH36_74g04016 [Paralvinella palmiformis]